MLPIDIILVRHGQSEGNKANKASRIGDNLRDQDYFPETISHREDQVNQVAKVLAPSLRMERPSNLFVYGKTGTGKTLTVKHVSQNLMKVAAERKIPINILYLNCKLRRGADTEYRR